MDSLANYGSDDDYEENSRDKPGSTSRSDGNRYYSPEEADANYDEVQMDLSEESNNNNSNEEDERQRESTPERRMYREHMRPDEARTSEHRSNNLKPMDSRDRSRQRENHRSKYDEDRSRRNDSKSKYERSGSSDHQRASPKYKDDRKEKSKKYRRSSSKERRRSSSRERRRSSSRERRRSSSRERRRSRSPRRSRRSRSKDRDNRYGKRFDRTTNKMAQLEKLGIEIKTPDAEFVTPQMLLQRSMDEQVQKIKTSTGIELPKYYNPAAMNPARYAEQIQKRRLLWQKKDTPENKTESKPSMGRVWETTTFAQDSDGKVASKFKRLMGIKDSASASNENKEILKKQEEMFSSMEQQYEVARTATHTMRGVGLGFGSYQYPR